MAQIEDDDLKNYNLKRFDCEDPFLEAIASLGLTFSLTQSLSQSVTRSQSYNSYKKGG